MKHYSYLIPWFPISVIVFYSIIIFGSQWGWIPGLHEMIDLMERSFHTYGLPALFISSLLESVAYLGLYFPGSAVIALSVLASDGSMYTFISISLTASVAISIGCLISYYLGSKKPLGNTRVDKHPQTNRASALWFIINHWHPNALGLWFFKRGFQGFTPMPHILLVIPIMFTWGMICCLMIYSLKEYAESDQTATIFAILVFWLMIDIYCKYQNKQTSQD